VNGADYLWQILHQGRSNLYRTSDSTCVVDNQTHTIVNNESRQIIRMLNSEFNALAKLVVDFYPEYLHSKIEQTQDAIYQPINNGVYRSGFAASIGV